MNILDPIYPYDPPILVPKDQVQKMNTVVYWSGTGNDISSLEKGTKFTAFFGKNFFISNGNSEPQKLSLDFYIQLQHINTFADIRYYNNYGDNVILSESIHIRPPMDYNKKTVEYKSTANYTLNQFDVIKFILYTNNNLNDPDSTINITINSVGNDIPPKISKSNDWYLIIFLFFIICALIAFYVWRRHHFHTNNVKKV